MPTYGAANIVVLSTSCMEKSFFRPKKVYPVETICTNLFNSELPIKNFPTFSDIHETVALAQHNGKRVLRAAHGNPYH